MTTSDFSDSALEERVRKGDVRAISRLISLAENRVPRARKIQAHLYKTTKQPHVIGITGSPGAGKSTLVDQLARSFTAQNKKVAIVAVDPTSPFSGGAILGDRIRMNYASSDSGVFIRSMATRGALGGLSRATFDTVQILAGGGFDTILIETVGVGQAEVDIARLADTCAVVLVPGMGDSVQTFKAGILEIADVFVINKADRDGVENTEKDLLTLLALDQKLEGGWERQIRRTVATKGEGIGELTASLSDHASWLCRSLEGERRKKGVLEHTIVKLAEEQLAETTARLRGELLEPLVARCARREIDPFEASVELFKKVQVK